MNKSQLQDQGIVNEELGKVVNDVEQIKSRLTLCQALAEKQAEEIEAMKKYKTAIERIRIDSIITFGVGGLAYLASCIPGVQEDFKKALLTSGVTAMGLSAISFGLSFTILF